ncbi:MAG: helix-turn-helix domain-containing protein [Rhodospirillaceae bacterium]|nr:helix-turn-helix domain-containing protein [Rhodospirillaceae bacterium]
MDIRKRFGMNVRQARQSKRLSQEQLGFDANSNRTYVSDVERAVRNPTITIVARFAKALGVSPGYLLDADPNAKNKPKR